MLDDWPRHAFQVIVQQRNQRVACHTFGQIREAAQIRKQDDRVDDMYQAPFDFAVENPVTCLRTDIGIGDIARDLLAQDGFDGQGQSRLQAIEDRDFPVAEPVRAIGGPGGENSGGTVGLRAVAERHDPGHIIGRTLTPEQFQQSEIHLGLRAGQPPPQLEQIIVEHVGEGAGLPFFGRTVRPFDLFAHDTLFAQPAIGQRLEAGMQCPHCDLPAPQRDAQIKQPFAGAGKHVVQRRTTQPLFYEPVAQCLNPGAVDLILGLCNSVCRHGYSAASAPPCSRYQR